MFFPRWRKGYENIIEMINEIYQLLDITKMQINGINNELNHRANQFESKLHAEHIALREMVAVHNKMFEAMNARIMELEQRLAIESPNPEYRRLEV